jgi:magnesium transporter
MPPPTDNDDTFFAKLFGAEQPRVLSAEELGVEPGDRSLLWVDLHDPPEPLLAQVWEQCGFPAEARSFLDDGTMPEAGQDGDYFWVRCVVVDEATGQEDTAGSVLVCVAGRNRVLSVRWRGIAFLDELRQAEPRRIALGRLSAESFVASLLDRQLSTYFDAISDYEMAVERLEVDLLGGNERSCLPELQRLRQWASRLRRMLAPHRNVFSVMARPDFRPDQDATAERHFVALDTRFERAMDMVENARELVIGSFELFSNQTALRTNDFMRVLTFVTVITGVLATIVGALGMNFEAGIFKSRDQGFWLAIGGLLLLGAVSLVLGKRRRWF